MFYWQLQQLLLHQLLRLDFNTYADTSDCIISFSFFPTPKPMYDTILFLVRVRYNLSAFSSTIWSLGSFMYDINLWATATTILSTRGVQIPIYLVSSTTDSSRWSVVLFKAMSILTSDPKSEFLCQLSSIVQNLQTPLEPPRTPGISPTPSSPRITCTAIVRVLSLSTWSSDSIRNAPNDLVVACQLKSSRVFNSNVTSVPCCAKAVCWAMLPFGSPSHSHWCDVVSTEGVSTVISYLPQIWYGWVQHSVSLLWYLPKGSTVSLASVQATQLGIREFKSTVKPSTCGLFGSTEPGSVSLLFGIYQRFHSLFGFSLILSWYRRYLRPL